MKAWASQVREQGGRPSQHHSYSCVKRPNWVREMTSQNCWSNAESGPSSAASAGKSWRCKPWKIVVKSNMPSRHDNWRLIQIPLNKSPTNGSFERTSTDYEYNEHAQHTAGRHADSAGLRRLDRKST